MFSLVETNRKKMRLFQSNIIVRPRVPLTVSSCAFVCPIPCHKENLFRLTNKKKKKHTHPAYTYLLLGTFFSFFNPVAEKASTKLKHTRGVVKMG